MRRVLCLLASLLAVLLGAAVLLDAREADAQDANESATPKIVFVTGDDEYGSETSMPMIAEILAQRHGMETTVLYAEDEKGRRDRHGHSIPGLEALQTADLVVLFLRFRALPQEQLDEILAFARSAKPMIGLRTSTHAFSYSGPPNNALNDEFGRRWWGQKWIDHYGHGNSSDALVVDAMKDHPVLRGVEPTFWLHSWLYIMNRGAEKLPRDLTILMEGSAVRGSAEGGERYGEQQPIAWTRELPVESGATSPARKRIFYTSIGHPKDFESPSARRLLINAIYWGLGREDAIPPRGADAEIVGAYAPEDPH